MQPNILSPREVLPTSSVDVQAETPLSLNMDLVMEKLNCITSQIHEGNRELKSQINDVNSKLEILADHENIEDKNVW